MALPDKDSAAGTFGVPHADAHPVEDATTDLPANQYDTMACDVAMMTHTIPRAWVRFVGATYVGPSDTIAVVDHDAVWGSATGVKPTVLQVGAAGTYVLSWAASQQDELGASHTINCRLPYAPVVIGADGLRAKVVAFTANTITINTTSAGAANALNGTTIFVIWS